jgi:hypothetical protein
VVVNNGDAEKMGSVVRSKVLAVGVGDVEQEAVSWLPDMDHRDRRDLGLSSRCVEKKERGEPGQYR